MSVTRSCDIPPNDRPPFTRVHAQPVLDPRVTGTPIHTPVGVILGGVAAPQRTPTPASRLRHGHPPTLVLELKTVIRRQGPDLSSDDRPTPAATSHLVVQVAAACAYPRPQRRPRRRIQPLAPRLHP